MSIVEAGVPWYLEDDRLHLEDDRELAEVFVAREDDHEWCLLRAYDRLRAEIVAERRPLQNMLARRSILERAIALAIQFHGGAILAGSLLALSVGGGVEVVRAASFPSKMVRSKPGRPKPTAEAKPPRQKAPAYYVPPVIVREGDFQTAARTVDGVVLWSVGVLNGIMAPRCVSAAMTKARYATPLEDHPRLFPALRSRINGKTAPVSCVSLEGLRVLAKYVPQNGKAGKALASYLESAG